MVKDPLWTVVHAAVVAPDGAAVATGRQTWCPRVPIMAGWWPDSFWVFAQGRQAPTASCLLARLTAAGALSL